MNIRTPYLLVWQVAVFFEALGDDALQFRRQQDLSDA
jgi:hypothetical protein